MEFHPALLSGLWWVAHSNVHSRIPTDLLLNTDISVDFNFQVYWNKIRLIRIWVSSTFFIFTLNQLIQHLIFLKYIHISQYVWLQQSWIRNWYSVSSHKVSISLYTVWILNWKKYWICMLSNTLWEFHFNSFRFTNAFKLGNALGNSSS